VVTGTVTVRVLGTGADVLVGTARGSTWGFWVGAELEGAAPGWAGAVTGRISANAGVRPEILSAKARATTIESKIRVRERNNCRDGEARALPAVACRVNRRNTDSPGKSARAHHCALVTGPTPGTLMTQVSTSSTTHASKSFVLLKFLLVAGADAWFSDRDRASTRVGMVPIHDCGEPGMNRPGVRAVLCSRLEPMASRMTQMCARALWMLGEERVDHPNPMTAIRRIAKLPGTSPEKF
jgi:hypothetical protein